MSEENWVKEVAAAFAGVAALLLILTLYTQVWPPMVVVESGSMMHPGEDGYGNLGVIDPGDLVLVKDVDGRGDVQVYMDGGRTRYGAPGDVIVYYPGNNRAFTPIIHRAMAWVDVRDDGYHVTGYSEPFPSSGITIDEWGLRNFRPGHDGFITMGDNNAHADQASGTDAVALSWVEGKARGEVPWIGLVKLALAPGVNQPGAPDDWVRVGNAYAPQDLWVMLAVSLVLLVAAPVAFDAATHQLVRARQEEKREEEP